MLRSITRGLGLGAMYDPAPGPGVIATLSGSSYIDQGLIEMVPNQGQRRNMTYREVYLTNPWVWAAVNILTKAIARTPALVYSLDADGNPTRIRSDTPQPPGRPQAGVTLDALMMNPTPGRSRGAVFAQPVRDKLIYGNGLWRLNRQPGGGGMPTSVKQIPWRQVARVKTMDAHPDEVLFYELQRQNGQAHGERILPADCVHFGLGSDEGAVGMSPLRAARYTLALHDAMVRHLLGYYKNSARASGHLTVDKVTPAKAREIREMITEMYASPENAGKVLVTSGNWQSVSDPPNQSDIAALIALSREELAATYMIPPPVLGILDRAMKSNVDMLREQFIRDAVGNQTTDFEQDVKAQLIDPVPSWDGLYMGFDLDAQLRPDLEARAMVYQRSTWWLTIDDVRRKENLAPLKIKGVTDVPWVPSGSQPISAWKDGVPPGGKTLPFPAPIGPPEDDPDDGNQDDSYDEDAPSGSGSGGDDTGNEGAGATADDVRLLISLLDDDAGAARRVALSLAGRIEAGRSNGNGGTPHEHD